MPGKNPNSVPTQYAMHTYSGNGGNGIGYSISGSPVFYAGGGGCGGNGHYGNNGPGSYGGRGGGGNGGGGPFGSANSGSGNTGSGGGGASFFTSNVLPSAGRVGSTSLSAGRGLNSIAAGAKSAKSYKALASGDIVGLMQKDGMSLYDKLGINTAEVTGDVAAKNPDSIALAAAKMLGLNADKTDSLVDFVSSGAKKVLLLLSLWMMQLQLPTNFQVCINVLVLVEKEFCKFKL